MHFGSWNPLLPFLFLTIRGHSQTTLITRGRMGSAKGQRLYKCLLSISCYEFVIVNEGGVKNLLNAVNVVHEWPFYTYRVTRIKPVFLSWITFVYQHRAGPNHPTALRAGRVTIKYCARPALRTKIFLFCVRLFSDFLSNLVVHYRLTYANYIFFRKKNIFLTR